MMAVMTVMTVLALALALLPLGLGAGPPQHQHLLMMDCEPSTQSNWTSWCFGQEFLEGVQWWLCRHVEGRQLYSYSCSYTRRLVCSPTNLLCGRPRMQPFNNRECFVSILF